MRLIYKEKHEGVWFSHNGHRAYENGERPRCLIEKTIGGWEPTVAHHIARRNGNSTWTRELVMFYKKKGETKVTP